MQACKHFQLSCPNKPGTLPPLDVHPYGVQHTNLVVSQAKSKLPVRSEEIISPICFRGEMGLHNSHNWVYSASNLSLAVMIVSIARFQIPNNTENDIDL